jgi:hypothetical protein
LATSGGYDRLPKATTSEHSASTRINSLARYNNASSPNSFGTAGKKVEAEHAQHGPAAEKAAQQRDEFEKEVSQVAPERHPDGNLSKPGNAPSQALQWAVQSIAKAGTLFADRGLSFIGGTRLVYALGTLRKFSLRLPRSHFFGT